MTKLIFMRTFRNRAVTGCIAAVWILFAVLGKLFPLTPTHKEIVARVFGDAFGGPVTILIGIGELAIAAWVLSGVLRRLCGWIQIAVVAIMNCIEFILAKDILMWGRLNALFAIMFIAIIYANMVWQPRDE